VADLRSVDELAHVPDPFAKQPAVTYINVPLYSCDLHDPKIEQGLSEATEQGAYGNFLVEGYLSMLANSAAMQRLFSFFATVPHDTCVLFHCTAGMDRTGVISMLLLALAGVDLEHIVADYAYSYTSVDDVDSWLFGDKVAPNTETNRVSLQTMRVVYQQLLRAYGSVEGYLSSCGICAEDVTRVRCHLLES
jgi:protein-tyrosine phosphatase